MNTDQTKTKLCVACASDIRSIAILCPQCGTRQDPRSRWFLRAVSYLSAISVVLSILTVGISLFPSAVSTLIPKEGARINSITFNSASLTRSQARIEIANTGNQDLYISRVKIEPRDNEFTSLNAHNYVVSDWLKVSENRIFLIPLKPLSANLAAMPTENWQEKLSDLEGRIPNPNRCFTLLIHSADAEQKKNVESHMVIGAILPLKAEILYSTARTRGDLKAISTPFNIDASLMIAKRCADLLSQD